MSPLEIKESLCQTYDRLRDHPNAYNLMQPYLDDAARHSGCSRNEFIPPRMRADFNYLSEVK